MLQYNGLYVSRERDNGGSKYYTYLRFYEDGLVMKSSSTGTPQEVIGWLHRDRPNRAKGFFQTQDNKIHFAVTSQSGVIVYEGEIRGNRLNLNSYSHINGHTASEEYVFVAA
jgi:hypothetical protein